MNFLLLAYFDGLHLVPFWTAFNKVLAVGLQSQVCYPFVLVEIVERNENVRVLWGFLRKFNDLSVKSYVFGPPNVAVNLDFFLFSFAFVFPTFRGFFGDIQFLFFGLQNISPHINYNLDSIAAILCALIIESWKLPKSRRHRPKEHSESGKALDKDPRPTRQWMVFRLAKAIKIVIIYPSSQFLRFASFCWTFTTNLKASRCRAHHISWTTENWGFLLWIKAH